MARKSAPMIDQIPLIFLSNAPSTNNEEPSDNITLLSDLRPESWDDYTPQPTDDIPIEKEDRVKSNLAALTLLNELQTTKRAPTIKEQQKLYRYTGWKGLYNELCDNEKNITHYQDVYDAPRFAYRTPAWAVNMMYKVLSAMGFENGSILCHGVGAGSFIGHMPYLMRKQGKTTAAVSDMVSAQLTRNLYPSIPILDEEMEWPENLFDVAIGPIPFEQHTSHNLNYRGRSEKLSVYEYTMKKSLIALRPGGIFAIIVPQTYSDNPGRCSSMYDMCLNSHLEHLISLRLDSDVFPEAYGSFDMLFFKKRSGSNVTSSKNWGITSSMIFPMISDPKSQGQIDVSMEFAINRHCIIGTPVIKRVGRDIGKLVVQPFDSDDRKRRAIQDAIASADIKRAYSPVQLDKKTESSNIVFADPKVKNYSMVIRDGEVYQRIDSIMVHQRLSPKRLSRVLGMIAIRDCARDLIIAQERNCTDDELETRQARLNRLYDAFVEEHGPLNNRTNVLLMREDAEFHVLASLEYVDDDDVTQKADIFFKRTVRLRTVITHCDTIEEAFEVCLDQLGYVDLVHIAKLCDVEPGDVLEKAAGVLFFKNPEAKDRYDEWVHRDEYLSGNVLRKQRIAKAASEGDQEFLPNVDALEKVRPTPIPSEDIQVQLGASWIPGRIIAQFIYEVILGNRNGCDPDSFVIEYDEKGRWKVISKVEFSPQDAALHAEYGTAEKSAFWLIEKTMNGQSIKGYSKDEKSGERCLDTEKTMTLNHKADQIRNAFKNWIFSEPQREAELAAIYNEKHNSLVVPKYDGSHLTFPGLSNVIEPKAHQRNAICRNIRQNGAYDAHKVGAGKTAIMIISGMELKRLGRINKPVYVVPNPLVSQWGGEFARLYPSANILIASPDEMQKARKERCLRRIATGDYDAVIMASSSFDSIPPPYELVTKVTTRRQALIEKFKPSDHGEKPNKANMSFKHSSRGMRNALAKIGAFAQEDLERIYKRTLVELFTLDQLGLDYLFLDEAHNYKSLRVESVRGNLKGITIGKTQKCQDMLYKVRYFNEVHGGKGGFVWASGTPIDNSIVELYAAQRYFQEELLIEKGIFTLDDWLNLFAVVTKDYEIPVEGLSNKGEGLQQVERVSSFINIQELMAMVHQFMDVQMDGDMGFDLPDAMRETVLCPMYPALRDYLDTLVDRAQIIRAGGWEQGFRDNMLSITMDAKLASLDLNLVARGSADFEGNKLNRCASKAAEVYHTTMAKKLTQIIFCDSSTPNNKEYNVYDHLKKKLIARGVKEDEIAFAHDFCDANKPKLILQLKLKMQTGKIRILIGSTKTVGTGLNVQNRLIALHHIDVPWTPLAINQREGRILRPGNKNGSVMIFQYVTEQSFDSYLWQLIETKARMIAQVMRGDYTGRTVEDTDVKVLNYAEVKAIATGNNAFLERTKVEGKILQLETLRREYTSRQAVHKQNVYIRLPESIRKLEKIVPMIEEDIRNVSAYTEPVVTVSGKPYKGEQDLELAAEMMDSVKHKENGAVLGTYKGMTMIYAERNRMDLLTDKYLVLQGKHSYSARIRGWHGKYLFMVCEEIIRAMQGELEDCKAKLQAEQNAYDAARSQLGQPFPQAIDLEILYLERDNINQDIIDFQNAA